MRRELTALLLVAALASSAAAPAIGAAEQASDHPLPATFDFDDGLQGWTVEELDLDLERGAQGRGIHDTTWSHVASGDGSPGVALTTFEQTWERYGDLAHIAFVSPWFAGEGGPTHLSGRVRYVVEGNTYDEVHVEWSGDGIEWTPIGEALGGSTHEFVHDDRSFTSSGRFRVRYRFVSDALGSGVSASPNGFDTFRLDDVRVATTPRPIGAAGTPVRPSLGQGGSMITAVVAITSTAPINPYNLEFRDDSPIARQHPSTYLPGYPADAQALPLHLDADSFEAAMAADDEALMGLEADRLYWIPGTKIVAVSGASLVHDAITGESHAQVCDEDGRCDLRPGGRVGGTWAASRAVGWQSGACPTCRLAVFAGMGSTSIANAADQAGWIDTAAIHIPRQVGWGVERNGATSDADMHVVTARLAEAVPVFVARAPHYTNSSAPMHNVVDQPNFGVGVTTVGAHDNGHVVSGNPLSTHLVADNCDALTALHQAIDGVGEHASLATQAGVGRVAGHAARIILEARRTLHDWSQRRRPAGVLAAVASEPSDPRLLPTLGPLSDGELDRDELRAVLRRTATPRPAGDATDGGRCELGQEHPGTLRGMVASLPVRWTDVPDDVPGFVNLGYGAADDRALALAIEVMRGRADAPPRPLEDAWFALDAEARRVHHAALLWEQTVGTWRPLLACVAGGDPTNC